MTYRVPVDELAPVAAHKEENSQAWMVTFTDLVSLMLTFFVMLFSMSSVQVDKWEEMIDTLSQTLNPTREVQTIKPTSTYNIRMVLRERAINLDYLMAVLEEKMAEDHLLSSSRLLHLSDRVIVSLPGDLLFGPNSALLSEKAREALFELGGVLRNINNQVMVQGHSDPVPPQGGQYASNWELSIGRAVAVANALRRAGYTEEIPAQGFASSRYNLLPDLPDVEKRKLARRVDIVIMPNVGED
ncbi:flagellar motor protein MotB [Magnetospira sp. QH-2]|uniref:OmpA/MotB family protein n=1 Tax=Magnetospira sp. (strain QH-2) TaxID=1288970 RepID=UPI0003E81044|nr:flagellar motor protein MotB [Magnetospira sp. QH-2]CCQ74117.1 putative Flagellar motor protein MotB [Magnetospira sp. QH-2]